MNAKIFNRECVIKSKQINIRELKAHSFLSYNHSSKPYLFKLMLFKSNLAKKNLKLKFSQTENNRIMLRSRAERKKSRIKGMSVFQSEFR